MQVKKPIYIIVGTIIILVLAFILFISPITKYLVEKYTGRQIELDWVYVNPFAGYIHIKNLKIFELKSDSIFFSAKGVSANFALFKLFSKTYEISKLTLNNPRGIIIQDKKDLNFDDLIKMFSPKEKAVRVKASSRFSILAIKIKDGEFYYREKVTPINYYIRNVNIESTGKRWDSDTLAAKFSFLSGIGNGGMKGNFTINFKNLDFRLGIVVEKFDLNILEQYLKDLTNYGYFSANLDADLNVKGNLKTAENVIFTGLMAINDFHAGDKKKDDYASFEKLSLAIYELSPKNHKYLFDSVSLANAYFRYEKYDYSDNLQEMFGTKESNIAADKSNPAKFNLVITIGNYIKKLSMNFFRSDYKVNRIAINNGNFEYNDYSLSEKFSLQINPLFVTADSIDKDHKRVYLFLKSGIKPYGNATLSLSINPKDSTDFDLKYQIQKLPVAIFNPYTITYTSFPLDRGTIELGGTWKVIDGKIKSSNNLTIIDPRVTKRLRNKDTKWIPLPLIMTFIRERGNVINYDIPITGDLKNPKFRLGDIIVDVLKNIFVNPPTIPYGIVVKNLETEIEKSLTLKWRMRQSSLLPTQEKFVERMADFLVENPKATIAVYPQQYSIKEKEYILFFEAKKKFYLAVNNKSTNSFDETDSTKVAKMSAKDTLFVGYLNKRINDNMLFTTQDKCSRVVDAPIVNAKYNQLNRDRERAFMNYFRKRGVGKRVKIAIGENNIPFNGFSFYKIEYKGEFPEALIKAYRKMSDLNDESPRKKYLQERKKIRNTL